jgi:hypothetical protein
MYLIIFSLLWSAFAGNSQCLDARGNDISYDSEAFQELIQNSKTCYEAARRAENCALGSSLDVSTVGYAIEVCKAEMDKYKTSKSYSRLVNLLTKMQAECTKAYSRKKGTMYLSFHAFCDLKAIEWVTNLVSVD